MGNMSTLPDSETTNDKPPSLNAPKIESEIATAEDFRKDWEARGCPEPSSLASLFEIDADPARISNNPELFKEFQRFTAFPDLESAEASIAMQQHAIAASLPSKDELASLTAMQISLAKMWQDDALTGQSAKMAFALADLHSKSMEASTAAAAQAIAAYLPPPDVYLRFVAEQASVAKMWRDDAASMGRYAETAIKLQAECLKAEEVRKTFEQAAGLQTAARMAQEMSLAESLYGFSAVEALLPRYAPALDLGLAALRDIGSSKATAAKPRPLPDRNRWSRTQPQVILSLAPTTSATTDSPSVVHGPSCSVSTALVVASPPPASVPQAEDEILRRMLTEGNAAAVVAHMRHQMGVQPKKRGRPAIKRELYAQAAHLREQESLSWARLARKMDPEGYRSDPAHCTLRFRKGVARFLKLHQTGSDYHN